MFKEAYKKITSLQNPIVKHLQKLREDRVYREKCQRALALGLKTVMQIAKCVPIHTLLSSDPSLMNFFPTIKDKYLSSSEILKKIAHLPSFDGVIAECALPPPTSLEGKKYILALDEIRDPGNMGTLVRTALALGWQGVFLLPGCCDLFNDKTLRAAKGGSFLLPFFYGTHEDLYKLCIHNEIPLLIADLEGQNSASLGHKEGALLLLSSESRGVKEELRKEGQRITIPLSSNMESLNVATAGAILMHQLKR